MATSERVLLHGSGLDLVADVWSGDSDQRGEVFLFHGGGQTRWAWKRTAQRLADEGWTTFAVDARGHGESDWERSGDYTTEAQVADVVALAGSRPRPPALVGASMGGHAALLATGENPGLASGLVLVDIAVSPEPAGLDRVIGFLKAGLAGFDSVEEAQEAVAAYNAHRRKPPTPHGLMRNLRERDGRWYWHWDPAIVSDRNAHTETVTARERRARQAALTIRVPTLLVRGAQSDIVTPEAARELVSLIPQAGYVDIAGTGHMVSGDDNDAFSDAVSHFLTTLDTKGSL